MSAVWVIKLGSSLITNHGTVLDHDWIDSIAAQIAARRAQGDAVVVVSSGSVAAGVARLGLGQRPTDLARLQAAAAVGQPDVMQAWSTAFAKRDAQVAQLLLSHEEARQRERYLNMRATLRTLLDLGVIPVVNENDSVATEEIRFGDNDRLAAMVADLVDADHLVLLTDQWGLYTANPQTNPAARRITRALASDAHLDSMAGGGGDFGRGGMITKLLAARQAARSGIDTWIAYGRAAGILAAIARGEAEATHLLAGDTARHWTARKRWMGAAMHAAGRYIIDAGAAHALQTGNVSLLPVGVTRVVGEFHRGDLVLCCDERGREIARGLSNYAAADARRICGLRGADISARLGWPGEVECIHRDNMVVLPSTRGAADAAG
ncbi:MAG: glutamate 5-kinase [Oceanococcaceae bacterium]